MPARSRPIGVNPLPSLKLKVGKAWPSGCWLMSIPCKPSCEIAVLPRIGKFTLVSASVNPKRNSLIHLGLIA